ncbi:MAG: hypothetical protein KatS3mg043_2081 [Rhodothermaceae bacterium]|nr:MAG: hypothetical protein KatS3mg043_2081 [Rhodothermaceae bacterium]
MIPVRHLCACLLGGLVVLLAGLPGDVVVPAARAQGAVMVEVRTVSVQLLRLSDFDPLRPERAPVFLHATVINDEQERELRLEVHVRSARFGVLVTGTKRLGRVAPFAVVPVTNRDIEAYEVADAGTDLVKTALERNVLPADEYVFEVRVFDEAGPGGGALVAEGEGVIVTENPGRQLDLVGPGTPFGQEPDVVATPFPIFQWLSDAARFNFALYEVRPHQRSPEDVAGSRPVFAVRDSLMTATVLPYPSFAEVLRPGVTYAWQVEAIVETAAGPLVQPSEMYWFVVEAREDLNVAASDGLPPVLSAGVAGEGVARLEVSPQEITLPPGGTFLFRAAAYDAADLLLPGVRVTWSLQPLGAGAIDEEGRFTAGEQPGVVAVTAHAGEVMDYATVFIEVPDTRPGEAVVAANDTLAAGPAAADTTGGVPGDPTRALGVRIVFPVEEQPVVAPGVHFAWQVAGADSADALRYRVSVFPVEAGYPAEEVPDVPPVLVQTVRQATSMYYPPGAPLLEPGRLYAVQVDVLDPEDNLLARSAPVRFTMAPQANVGWDLRQAWDNALRQGQQEVTLTLLAELRTPALAPLDRQALLNTNVQIDLEDGPWLQLSVPVSSLPALVQLPFLRLLTLPAPPWFSGREEAHEATRPPAPTPARRTVAAARPASNPSGVGVAVFEFGYDVPRLRSLLEAEGVEYALYSFRRDRRLDGRSPEAAAHGLTTVQALIETLPEASHLHLFNFETELEFRAALRYAVDSLGVRVATSSVSWMDAYDHYDGTGYLFGPNLAEMLGERAVLVAAAGNFARSHWEGRFSDPDGDGRHNFTPERNGLTLSLSGEEVYNFLLSWDDWEQPEVDLDLYLLDETGQPLYDAGGYPMRSVNRQGRGRFEKPTERIRSFVPPYPGTQPYRLEVRAHRLRPGAAPPHFELYMYPWPEDSDPAPEGRSSLASGLAVARPETVVPVAAVDFEHSSQGPTNDGRLRPDFAADGVVRRGEVEALWPVGTSFAAPRVAAALARIFDRHPDWPASRALQLLRTCVDPPAGAEAGEKDPRFGWGAVNLDRLREALR